jgi:hypothetical protein
MMKISDPIMFGHVVTAFFEPVFTKYASDFASVGINPNNGFNDVLEKVNSPILRPRPRPCCTNGFGRVFLSGCWVHCNDILDVQLLVRRFNCVPTQCCVLCAVSGRHYAWC